MSNPFASWSIAQVEAHNGRIKIQTAASLLAEAKEREVKKKTAKLRAANGKSEAEIQQEIADWLTSRRIFFIRSRMDRATSVSVGTPDFIGFSREFGPFAIEVKKPGCKETREQAGQLLHAKLEGARVGIAHSLKEAIQILNTP